MRRYVMGYQGWVKNGCLRAYFADILTVGSSFRHLLMKSMKSLSSQFSLALRFVSLGTYSRQGELGSRL